jgi:hypothetical protein
VFYLANQVRVNRNYPNISTPIYLVVGLFILKMDSKNLDEGRGVVMIGSSTHSRTIHHEPNESVNTKISKYKSQKQMKRSTLMGIVILGIAILMNSCATIFGGTKYVAHVTPSNKQADVYMNDIKYGTGDTKIKVKRSNNLNLTLKAEVCDDLDKMYVKEARIPIVILSFLSWGLLGIIVDFADGAAYKPDVDIPGVQKIDDKNYKFIVDYVGCPEADLSNK